MSIQISGNERHICGNCRFGSGIGKTTGPSPSGPEDGVLCTNIEMAKKLDGECGDNFHQEEFAEYGGVNLFRIEVIDDMTDCDLWRPKEVMPSERG